MGVTVATTRVACTIDAPPYTQDITTADLGGLTPKAALFICSYSVTDATAADHNNLSIGAATGASEEWCLSTNDEHNQGTTDNYKTTDSDRCIRLNTPSTDTIDGEAEFIAFIANGVRINWLNAPSSAWLLTVVLFAGTDLSAHAGYAGLGNTVDLTTDITAPGFEPDIVLTAGQRTAIDSGNAHWWPSIGIVHNDDGITQHSYGNLFYDNVATSSQLARYTESYGILEVAAGANLDWGGEFGTFDANGFSVTTRINGANNSTMFYLALNFNSAVDAWVGTHTTPTSTGNDSETNPGFKPQIVIQGLSLVEAVDTGYSDNRTGALGFSVFDADHEYTTIGSSEDAVATTNTQSLADDRAIVVPDDDGTLDIEATFVSFDANGWTVNYSNAPATAKLFWALAIEEEGGAPSLSIPVAMHHYMHKVFG